MRHSFALIALTYCACSPTPDREPSPPEPPAPPLQALLDTSTWATWRAPTFALKHPPGARVVADTDRFSGFVGQAIVWHYSDSDPLRLAIAHVASASTPLATFVDSIRTVRNGELDLPDWDFAVMAPASTLAVGETLALLLRPYCGDCVARELYLDLGDARLAVSFSLEQGLPYSNDEQFRLYRLIVGTLTPAPRGVLPN